MWCDKPVFSLGLALTLLWSGAAAAFEMIGAPETVFAGGPGLCGTTVIPDAPARALRTADGRVLLFATHHDNRLLAGPDLDRVALDCASVYRGAGSHAPADYDDHAWIAAPYSPDGRIIHALVHDELHGHRRPDLCPAARYMACWANRITAATSTDGGRSFRRTGLVATPPYRYDGTLGRHVGYFNPSNIIEKDGWYYATVFATEWGAQRLGNCLMRSRDPGDPASWRAWDGSGFTVRFVDPYRTETADPGAHVCAPAGPIKAPITGIVRHRPSGRYLATLAADGGIYVSTSPDLIAWTAPRLMWPVPVIGRHGCSEPWAIAYPVLLDPAAPERNFESVGDAAWLYYTRMWTRDCGLTMRRDLMRVRVRIGD